MNKLFISEERRKYLKNIKRRKCLILLTQIFILIIFLGLWEFSANRGIIDSFITSKPSRILDTFMHLTSNNLLKHIGVTVYETVVGFLLGTLLGVVIAIVLWWSDFLSKVSEPYLVVLNSLPKVALRTNYNNMGRSRNSSNNCYGNCNFFNSNNIREPEWIFKNRQRSNENGKII